MIIINTAGADCSYAPLEHVMAWVYSNQSGIPFSSDLLSVIQYSLVKCIGIMKPLAAKF